MDTTEHYQIDPDAASAIISENYITIKRKGPNEYSIVNETTDPSSGKTITVAQNEAITLREALDRLEHVRYQCARNEVDFSKPLPERQEVNHIIKSKRGRSFGL